MNLEKFVQNNYCVDIVLMINKVYLNVRVPLIEFGI